MRDPRDPPRLKPNPDWGRAAQLLVDGCAHAPDANYRVELLGRLASALGDSLYPAFLQVLTVVGERGAPAAQAAVAEALVDALRSGRLPAGRRSPWGSNLRPELTLAAALGPVEYLCAWYAEPGSADAPSAARFDSALRSLLALVSQSDRARALYAARLMALAEDPLDGTLSRTARQALRALALAWQRQSPAAAADAAVNALSAGGALAALRP
jgi:hypothetical protein